MSFTSRPDAPALMIPVGINDCIEQFGLKPKAAFEISSKPAA